MASWFRYVESDGASEVEATVQAWALPVTDDGIRSSDSLGLSTTSVVNLVVVASTNSPDARESGIMGSEGELSPGSILHTKDR